jgi:hypothetical protein
VAQGGACAPEAAARLCAATASPCAPHAYPGRLAYAAPCRIGGLRAHALDSSAHAAHAAPHTHLVAMQVGQQALRQRLRRTTQGAHVLRCVLQLRRDGLRMGACALFERAHAFRVISPCKTRTFSVLSVASFPPLAPLLHSFLASSSSAAESCSRSSSNPPPPWGSEYCCVAPAPCSFFPRVRPMSASVHRPCSGHGRSALL